MMAEAQGESRQWVDDETGRELDSCGCLASVDTAPPGAGAAGLLARPSPL